jgi:hypothetical protein
MRVVARVKLSHQAFELRKALEGQIDLAEWEQLCVKGAAIEL